MSVGRETLRELFELKLDLRDEPVFPLTQVNFPVDLAAAGNRHAFYETSVVCTPEALSVAEDGLTPATDISYSLKTFITGGRRITALVITNNNAIATAMVSARVFRIRGLADT